MSLREMLLFSGSVLGPALIAAEVSSVLSIIPSFCQAKDEIPPNRTVDELLASVFREEFRD